MDKPVEVNGQDTIAHAGSNCILKCTIDSYHQDHHQVASWTTDDGLIFLPVPAYNDDPQGELKQQKELKLLIDLWNNFYFQASHFLGKTFSQSSKVFFLPGMLVHKA